MRSCFFKLVNGYDFLLTEFLLLRRPLNTRSWRSLNDTNFHLNSGPAEIHGLHEHHIQSNNDLPSADHFQSSSLASHLGKISSLHLFLPCIHLSQLGGFFEGAGGSTACSLHRQVVLYHCYGIS